MGGLRPTCRIPLCRTWAGDAGCCPGPHMRFLGIGWFFVYCPQSWRPAGGCRPLKPAHDVSVRCLVELCPTGGMPYSMHCIPFFTEAPVLGRTSPRHPLAETCALWGLEKNHPPGKCASGLYVATGFSVCVRSCFDGAFGSVWCPFCLCVVSVSGKHVCIWGSSELVGVRACVCVEARQVKPCRRGVPTARARNSTSYGMVVH